MRDNTYKYINSIYSLFFSDRRRKQVEKVIFYVAIAAYIVHNLLIFLLDLGIFPENVYGEKGTNPNLLSAIYTPFSIILLYEIYLLIYYLPKSINIYLGKQYEIVALIVIRKIFADLAELSLADELVNSPYFKNLLWIFGGWLVLLILIFCFYKLSGAKRRNEYQCSRSEVNFVCIKKVLAILLLLVFFVVFFSSFSTLFAGESPTVKNTVNLLKDMSYGFFDLFFTALILTEVLLLLFTLNLSDSFSKVIRNSGFIISTILLKLSFNTAGIYNICVILIAVSFGVLILAIYKLFKQLTD